MYTIESGIRSFLKPPVFEDEERNQLTRLLYPIVLSSFILLIPILLGLLLIGSERTLQSARIGTLSLAGDIGFLVLLRRGHVRFVSYALALTIWGLCSAGVLLQGGIQSTALGFLVFSIIYAFLLLGHWTGLFFWFLSVATLGGAFVADHYDRLPHASPMPTPAILLIYLLIFTASGWVVDIVTRGLHQSLDRAQEAEHKLRYKAELQALVTQLSTEFINLPPDQVDVNIRRGMEAVSMFVGADACRLWLCADDYSTVTLAHEWCGPGSGSFASTPVLSSELFNWLLARLQRLEVVYVPSVDDLPAEARDVQALWRSASVKSALQVPLAVGGRLAGVITFCAAHPTPDWLEDVTQLLTVAGTIFFQALERQKVEEQRHSFIAQRERVVFINTFIGNVTHDIKNPLAVIRTNLYIARHTDDSYRLQSSLNVIEMQAARINALVDDLLLLARLDADQPLVLAPTDLKQLLEDVVSELRPFAEGKHLAYKISLPAALPLVLAQMDDLRRVFVNLVENAIRYTPHGRSVALWASTEEETIVVQVQDTGIGIPPAALPRIFERFFRADNARSTSSTGTGLGLAIVQQIVDQHGGQIKVESTEGEGSTFWITLPCIA